MDGDLFGKVYSTAILPTQIVLIGYQKRSTFSVYIHWLVTLDPFLNKMLLKFLFLKGFVMFFQEEPEYVPRRGLQQHVGHAGGHDL